MFIARSLYNCKKNQLKKVQKYFLKLVGKNCELACNFRLNCCEDISIHGNDFKKSAQAESEAPASVMRDMLSVHPEVTLF